MAGTMIIGTLNTVFIATSLSVFAAFAWGVAAHFRSTHTPTGMKLISGMSLLTIAVVVFQAWSASLHAASVGVGLVMHLAALTLFLRAVRATRRQRLTLAFDDDRPTFLVATGPYRFVRHPFYTSYIIFWAGCALVLRDPYVFALFVTILILYCISARGEEAKFASSDLRDAYQDYRRHAGFLWPKRMRRS